VLLEDVLKEYLYYCQAKGFTPKTMKNKNQELKQIRHYLIEKRGITELESVTSYDLNSYVRLKQKDGLQPQSIVSMFKMIKAFFNWCEREGYIKENVTQKIILPKVPKKILKGFTNVEVQRMIDAFSYKNYIEARNKAIIAILADCGLRSMEVRGLLSFNVKETSLLIHGKGNKERIVFVSPALKRILIRYERIKDQAFKDKQTTDHYFLSYKGTELSHVALDNIIKKAGERAGVEDKRVSPHTFRHYFSVQCLLNSVDIYSLSKLLGHSELSTTQKYLQSLEDFELINKAMRSSPLMNINKKQNLYPMRS
jgi:integrase/recombinase XerD